MKRGRFLKNLCLTVVSAAITTDLLFQPLGFKEDGYVILSFKHNGYKPKIFWNGTTYDFAKWDRALTPEEINTLYNNGKSMANWKSILN